MRWFWRSRRAVYLLSREGINTSEYVHPSNNKSDGQTQEKLVQERLHLLTRLSTFLPPPLAHIIDSPSPSIQRQGQLPHDLDLIKFWNSNVNAYPMNGMGIGGGDRWWSIEELGEGASVVRSKTGLHGNGVDREVWVLRVGSDDSGGSESNLSSPPTQIGAFVAI